ncbi:hypothetical protein IWQ60_011448 [Tieghemiomyces parasiticus]|uniref:asparaginase n=1 Tax=Tieghemiomyces parasiticus TaxID=78921 RepID=A0A9W7ZNA8_9FUNG|nr:hypothetical protein IWQ60_011448 [Tieghemiomyces parasiticus]
MTLPFAPHGEDTRRPNERRPSNTHENQVVKMLRTADVEDMLMPDVSRVLIIYTGGTIGMKNTEHGYMPEPNYFSSRLSTLGRFHDSTASLSPYALSRTSSTGSMLDLLPPNTATATKLASPGPESDLHSDAAPTDSEVKAKSGGQAPAAVNGEGVASDTTSDTDADPIVESSIFSPWLITPPSLYGKRIRYRVLEYCPLLDSCNMTMNRCDYQSNHLIIHGLTFLRTHLPDWIHIANDVERFYSHFDAFIILHGTDTMAYTASALSFLLEDLGKTVILTGSQIPISEVRNDAIENLLGALTIAGHFVIPEVSLFFGNTLYRGNRTSKVDAMNFAAFDSPNLQPLVKMGVNIQVNWSDVLRPTALTRFRAHKNMNPNVATLRLFPGITAAAIRAFLRPPLVGVVLETYGAGNAPNTREDFIRELRLASARGVVIVNCTQCTKGLVSDLYATSKHLAEAQVVPGRDMTSECALTKLSYLLSKNYTPEECRALMGKNLRGELTTVDPHHELKFHNRVHHFLQYLAASMFSQRMLGDLSQPPETLPNLDRNGNADVGSNDTAELACALRSLHMSHVGSAVGSHGDGEVNNPEGAVPNLTTTREERYAVEKTLFPILICAASATGDLDGLRALRQILGSQFQLNCVDYSGRTPLHLAAGRNRATAVEFLLRNGASVHVLDQAGHTPLFDAVLQRNRRCIEMLVLAGAHFNDKELGELNFRFLK